ncbi:ankyrin repeat domain-containing protein [Sodalis sp. dw_96]|uniref:ankyrin repeat domain-containing protein n=1 Tax=Sodalis sp. dw_96 TaxID=2719794 RepID=UPI001BD68183|nr:ankyrin repeat domain-containing protein [Sodalis sp. dw_96]
MNTTLQSYTQPWTGNSFELMPIVHNQYHYNYSEWLNMTSNKVLPLIREAGQFYGTKPDMSKSKGEKRWLTSLKINKRETYFDENVFEKRLGRQARLGCLRSESRKGRLPRCNVVLDSNILKIAEEKTGNYTAYNKDRLTPLMQAVATNKGTASIKYMIQRGVHVNFQDIEGNTALMWLVKSLFMLKDPALYNEKLKIMEQLREQNATLDLAGTAGYTPLMVTVLGKDPRPFFKLLLDGAQEQPRNHAGETALHLAIKYDTHWMISVILRYGATDDNIKDKNGHTPFMIATFQEKKDIMEFYIRRKVNLDMIDNMGWTVLMHAVNCGNVSMVEYLLGKGANVNYANAYNDTALRIALHKNDQKIIHMLSNAAAAFKDIKGDHRPALTLKGDAPVIDRNRLLNTTSIGSHASKNTENASVTMLETEDKMENASAGTRPGVDNKSNNIVTTFIALDNEIITTESTDNPLSNKMDMSDYTTNENNYGRYAETAGDVASSKAGGLSTLFSSRFLGDVDTVYQSLKRIMSRRSISPTNS